MSIPSRRPILICILLGCNGVLGTLGAPHPPPGEREALLVQRLQSLDAPLSDRADACRQLAMIGGRDSLPALAGLLADEHLSTYARMALEAMEDPAADQVLRDALDTLAGNQLAGVINSVGVRRDAAAVDRLQQLAQDPASGMTEYALAALGQIATRSALAALQPYLLSDSRRVRTHAAHAALVGAGHLLAAGRAPQAIALFDNLCEIDVADHLRAASIQGAIQARGPAGVLLLIQQLQSSEPTMRQVGLSLARTLPGPVVTRALVAELETAPPELQVNLIEALTDRGDPAVRACFETLVTHSNPTVRIQSLKALGQIGDRSSIAALVQGLGGATQERDAAHISLCQIQGEAVDSALAEMLARTEPPLQLELVQILTARGAEDAMPEVAALTASAQSEVVAAAYKAIGQFGGQADMPGILEAFSRLEEGPTLQAAERALLAIARRTGGEDELARRLCDAPRAGFPVAARVACLRMLGNLHTDRSLQALRMALDDDEAATRDMAARQLSGWPDARALPVLERIIAATPYSRQRALALKGYLRLIAVAEHQTVRQRAQQVLHAWDGVTSPEDARLILGGLHQVPHPKTLQHACTAMENTETADEAAWAIVRIAPAVAGSAPEATRAALQRVVDANADPTLTQSALELQRCMDRFDSYVLGWMVSPVFHQSGMNYLQLLDHPFEPELETRHASWTPVPLVADALRPWTIDLDRLYTGERDAAVYLRTWIKRPTPQRVQLEIGSDDGIKIWVNGATVHRNQAARAVQPGEDRAEAILAAGWNELLVKVTQNHGPWGLCLRLRAADGSALEHARVDAFHEPAPGVDPDDSNAKPSQSHAL